MALTTTSSTASTEVQNAVYKLMATDRVALQRLQTQQSELTSKTTLYKGLASKLSSLLTLTRTFATASTDNPLRKITVSGGSSSSFSVTTDGTAAKGTHTIQVDSIATRHAIASSRVESSKKAGASGTASKAAAAGEKAGRADTEEQVSFRITAGGVEQEYTFTRAADLSYAEVMQKIADAINDVDGGPVTAAVVEQGNGNSRLVLQSASTGEAARITAVEDLEGTWMADLGLAGVEAEGTPLTSTVQAAADARLHFNGIEITSAGNTVSNLVKGITLELHAESSAASVRVQPDTDTVTSGVENFITQFNAAVDEIRSLTQAADSTGSNRGVFASDPSITRLRTSLRDAMTRQVESDGSLNSLSEIGLTTDRTGHLTLSDAQKFRDALESDPEAVEKLWTGADGVGTRLANILKAYATSGTTYTSQMKTFTTQSRSLVDRIAREKTRQARREDILTEQIAELQTTTATLTSQKTYLNTLLLSGEALYG